MTCLCNAFINIISFEYDKRKDIYVIKGITYDITLCIIMLRKILVYIMYIYIIYYRHFELCYIFIDL